MQSKVSIIIPVIRKEGMERCVKAIYDNAGVPPETFEVVHGFDKDRIGCPKMVKALVEKTQYDLVMFLADDTIPKKDFLVNALKAMETLPDGWGLVGLNDGIKDGDKLATHWLASKKLLPYLDGEFFSTDYLHNYCDYELTVRCKDLGRYVWAQNARIEHKHFIKDQALIDDDYRKISSSKVLIHDRNMYSKRLGERLEREKEWKLKVPKILHLYWGCNKKLSFMRYMTALSFSRLNPDWKIIVHGPNEVTYKEAWHGFQQKSYDYKGEDYFPKLQDIPNLEYRIVDFEEMGLDGSLPEVFKSDLLRLKLLGTVGGVWSDFDILYLRSMGEMGINKEEFSDSDVFVCCHHRLNRIGFLAAAEPSSKDNFFTGLLELYDDAKKKNLIWEDDYQGVGRYLFDSYFMYNRVNREKVLKDKGWKIENIPFRTVYPVMGNVVQKIYNNDFVIRQGTIGIHWFAGDSKTSRFENVIDEENLSAFSDKNIFRLMMDSLGNEGIKYSILMPYHRRSDQLHNTLISLEYHYSNRDDIEVIIAEDIKNIKDEDEHKKLLAIIENFRYRLNIVHIETNYPDSHNPSMIFNDAAKAAEGSILVLTNPECFHKTDILSSMDEMFQYNSGAYVVCSCEHVSNYQKRIDKFDDFDYSHLSWYQHSKFSDKRLHFCSVISKFNYELVGGFDERFAKGTDFDDGDFREKIKEYGISTVTRDDIGVAHQRHSKEAGAFAEGEESELFEKNRVLFFKNRRSEFKLGIGLPHTSRHMYSHFVDSWVMLEKPDFVYMRPPFQGQVDIAVVRNSLVKQALESGCSHIIMMDTDQSYPPDALTKMLSHNKKIVGAVVHRRYPPFDAILYRGTVGSYFHVPDDECYSGDLIEVDATGCGCIMYDMEVFVKVKPPWFETIKLEGGRTVGEDIDFCSKLKDVGYEIFVDTSIEIGHFTIMEVNRSTYSIYKNMKQFEWKEEGA